MFGLRVCCIYTFDRQCVAFRTLSSNKAECCDTKQLKAIITINNHVEWDLE